MMLFGNITVCTSTISSAGAELVAEAEAAGVRAGVVTAGVATTGGAMAGGSTVVAGALAVAPCQQADRGALGQEAWSTGVDDPHKSATFKRSANMFGQSLPVTKRTSSPKAGEYAIPLGVAELRPQL